MVLIRLLALFCVFLTWGYYVSGYDMPYIALSAQLGLSIIVAALSSAAWLFGAWFIQLGNLSGHVEGARLIKLLIPFAPLYLVGLPLVGESMASPELFILSGFSILANYKAKSAYEVVWNLKKGWRAKFPDSGRVPLYEYRKIYRQMVAIYIALPLVAWLVLPLLFRNS